MNIPRNLRAYGASSQRVEEGLQARHGFDNPLLRFGAKTHAQMTFAGAAIEAARLDDHARFDQDAPTATGPRGPGQVSR